jgi:type III restriction enzyme
LKKDIDMKIHLEQLKHQQDAIETILTAFPQTVIEISDETSLTNIYSNPLLKNAGKENCFIDCKMETGTGKTYVYTRLMYELQQRMGLYKFIIIVPSLAIKEGTKNFINSDYARQHFARFFPHKHINLQSINAGDFSTKKNKHKLLPNGLVSYCNGNRNEINQIQCLLINDAMLNREDSKLYDNTFDQTFFNSNSCPSEAIKQTRPVVILDEPHRIRRDKGAYKKIIEKFEPQLIIRFGATFPEISVGTGKEKIVKKDFYRGSPVYDLGAVESFNQGLVKAVDIQFANLDNENRIERYKVTNLTNKKLTLKKGNNVFEVNVGENLPADFEGNVTYEGGSDKELSNDLKLAVGMELTAGVFSNSYQEILLTQAINAHFEKEQMNFFRNDNRPKIKTLSLFFIDSIKSYRDVDGWLKQKFEYLLNEKLDNLLREYKNKNGYRQVEYREFLQTTKTSLASGNQDVHAGYFAEDRGKGDEAIQAEVDDILRNKEKMLSFKNENGTWNTRRFLFSKWTLREGWDNPNVFTICKLRTSGSETSKIQEVGRGLRLPVDEQGNRISNEEFRLNYIIGWDEKDFAEKLVGEINSDAKVILNHEKLTAEMIKIITNYRNINEEPLLKTLDEKNIIKRTNEFVSDGYERLIKDYPELLQMQLQSPKVTSPTMQNSRPKIKLRINNWNKIAGFWEEVSKRYMLKLERLPDGEIDHLVDKVLKEDIFSNNPITVTTQSTEKDENGNIKVVEQRKTVEMKTNIGLLQYGDFVQKLHKQTFIPVAILHKKIWSKLMNLSEQKMNVEVINRLINENSINKFVAVFDDKFLATFATKYTYMSLNFSAETSIKKDGSFIEELERGLVGVNDAADIVDDCRNLYDLPLSYDSELEHEVMKVTPTDKVIVYGKLPKRCIKLPTYTGGTTSPDFIYAISRDHEKTITSYLIVETKSDNPHLSDNIAIESQEEAFKNFSGNIKWQMVTNLPAFEQVLKKLTTDHTNHT